METFVEDQPKTREALREEQQSSSPQPPITPLMTVTRDDLERDTYVPANPSSGNPRALQLASRLHV